jgi:hypothetical protein
VGRALDPAPRGRVAPDVRQPDGPRGAAGAGERPPRPRGAPPRPQGRDHRRGLVRRARRKRRG